MKKCNVCLEHFNKSTHAPIMCPFCHFDSCSKCTERYLCETSQDAHCMSCRKGWSREILATRFSQKFVSKDYKTHREQVLLDREKSLMPATQPYVELEMRARVLEKKLEGLRKKFALENLDWTLLMNQPLLTNDPDERIEKMRKATEQRKILLSVGADVDHAEWTLNHLRSRDVAHGASERRQFVRACPFENCKGFLNTAWKCGLCENRTCSTCHEVKKDDDHVCDPDSVATAQLLAKDSRSCPACAAMIFKIDGCDQMFCTQCQTAFSWRTGRVETGVVHNPHYYEFMRLRGDLPRAPGDVPCGGMPALHTFVKSVHPSYRHLAGAHRSWGHCQYHIMPKYTVHAQNDNRDFRVKLMIGDIQNDEFKKKIQQREKARQKKTDIRQVLEMYTAVVLDLFQAFKTTLDSDVIMTSLTRLRDHFNETMSKISFTYGKCATPRVGEFFDMY